MEHKRRGRKREHDHDFFHNADVRVNNIRQRLLTAKADGLSVQQRNMLRGQISAQNNRVRKRKEQIYLNDQVKVKDQKFQALTQVLFKQLPEHQLKMIFQKMTDKWNIYNNVPTDKYQKTLADNFQTPQHELDNFLQNEYK